jgi:hypothetical protein
VPGSDPDIIFSFSLTQHKKEEKFPEYGNLFVLPKLNWWGWCGASYICPRGLKRFEKLRTRDAF